MEIVSIYTTKYFVRNIIFRIYNKITKCGGQNIKFSFFFPPLIIMFLFCKRYSTFASYYYKYNYNTYKITLSNKIEIFELTTN
ncbi:hypothetical protein PFUGPA_04276 [Plasmodium falciparum Palo Alto/Uganda]|uniref:Uncharacterized protein n=5 Tax=Plasmodium falciparum TaxID=5833 RepID=W7JKJ3_PLAFO|nr:hypothetical protein PFNF135_05521 [Plasmodium falciparum NF135/5.C10]ETW46341.1 hypothetical protein PFMALIP_05584 [Plasmodium falciparum MaliPS096_E11]ETW54410.1 hypothetical protein PFUGPA_04276 [Plasmodium falciparum Palo Alto/Uganda]EUR62100.1 hypothetical protein PFBG_05815 [Plasmodium falciparum 7G8]EWC85383.1 hypothetical protein PFNF54_05858 [Plasmodium falciparum NF54]